MMLMAGARALLAAAVRLGLDATRREAVYCLCARNQHTHKSPVRARPPARRPNAHRLPASLSRLLRCVCN